MVSPITGILNQRVDPRIPALLGLFFLALSFYLNTFLSIDPPYWLLLLPICVRGIGFGLIFITVQSVAIASMPREKISQGSGLINLSRQIGASFGVALIGLILSQRNIFHTAVSGEGVNVWSEPFRVAAAQLHSVITSEGGQTSAVANTLTQMLIVRDASTKAFIESVNDSFIVVTLMISVLVIPVMFWKFPKKTAGPAPTASAGKPAEGHAVAME
jgi:DHA2 family multidrug resistance protein